MVRSDSDQRTTVVCDHCDDTGWIYESCGCYECEYDNKHGREIPCANCSPASDEKDQ